MHPARTGLSADQQRISNVRMKILKDEQQRLELEQRLRALNSRSSQLHQRKQIQHIQTYFNRLNDQSQRAEQQNLQLLHQLTEARQRLDQLHNDAEHLIHLKDDYEKYLESRYPAWQRPMVSPTREGDHLNVEGNLRRSSKTVVLDFSLSLIIVLLPFSSFRWSILRWRLVTLSQTVRSSAESRS